ncbi:unnamed protein product [Rangifer tarandus platyrhynchus]|uniref:Uncharacterized protein n=1 Tax=Rangifer tarandus platyrhynchus TaxID=3082113 RepID=A0ACB1MJM2_RANTA
MLGPLLATVELSPCPRREPGFAFDRQANRCESRFEVGPERLGSGWSRPWSGPPAGIWLAAGELTVYAEGQSVPLSTPESQSLTL